MDKRKVISVRTTGKDQRSPEETHGIGVDARRAEARRNEVTLKIVLDAETKMKNNAIGRVTIYRVYKRG